MSLAAPSVLSLMAAFQSLGFTPSRAGLRRGDLTVSVDANWCVFSASLPDAGAPAVGLGSPGLWQPAPGRKRPVRELHLPAAALGIVEDDEAQLGEALADHLSWVTATAAGQVPPGWSAPPLAEVESWIPAAAMAVQSGPFAVRASWVREERGLALRCPILPRLDRSLGPARRAWLETNLAAARSRWRLVRVGSEPGGDEAAGIRAEVDLSGAPGGAQEALARCALDALRWVVSWLLLPLRCVGDPRIACDAWDLPVSDLTGSRARPAERSFAS